MSEIASHSHGGWDVHMHLVPPGVVAAGESCRYVMQIASLDAVRRFYVDSLVHSATFLESLIGLVGEGKILLGSDWLFSMGARHAENDLGTLAPTLRRRIRKTDAEEPFSFRLQN